MSGSEGWVWLVVGGASGVGGSPVGCLGSWVLGVVGWGGGGFFLLPRRVIVAARTARLKAMVCCCVDGVGGLDPCGAGGGWAAIGEGGRVVEAFQGPGLRPVRPWPAGSLPFRLVSSLSASP